VTDFLPGGLPADLIARYTLSYQVLYTVHKSPKHKNTVHGTSLECQTDVRLVCHCSATDSQELVWDGNNKNYRDDLWDAASIACFHLIISPP